MGTIINALAIVVGSLLGLLLRRGISKKIEDIAMKLLGVSVFLIGIEGVLSSMITVGTDGKLIVSGSMLLIVSLVLGGVAGELLDIDDALLCFGKKIEGKFGTAGFAKGFVNATLIFCVGAMSIVGAISDGLTGDSSVLLIKSALDFACSVILSSAMGFGVLFAFIPVLLYQGAITLLAGWLAPLVSGLVLDGLCMVGYAIVLVIGTNFLECTSIRTANLLPAFFGPILYCSLLPILQSIPQHFFAFF